MDTHVLEQNKNETALRIRRVREAFAEARNQAQPGDGVATSQTQDEPIIEFMTFNNED